MLTPFDKNTLAYEIDAVPFVVPLYQPATYFSRPILPDPPNGYITSYPDPSLVPDRYAYGSGPQGMQPHPSVPKDIFTIYNMTPKTPPQDASKWYSGKTLFAPVPNFTNVES